MGGGDQPMNHSEIVSFIWGVADLIRDTFRRGKYQDVILPLTVLRRLDCVLAPTKPKVLARQAELRGKKLENLDPQLRKASGRRARSGRSRRTSATSRKTSYGCSPRGPQPRTAESGGNHHLPSRISIDA